MACACFFAFVCLIVLAGWLENRRQRHKLEKQFKDATSQLDLNMMRAEFGGQETCIYFTSNGVDYKVLITEDHNGNVCYRIGFWAELQSITTRCIGGKIDKGGYTLYGRSAVEISDTVCSFFMKSLEIFDPEPGDWKVVSGGCIFRGNRKIAIDRSEYPGGRHFALAVGGRTAATQEVYSDGPLSDLWLARMLKRWSLNPAGWKKRGDSYHCLLGGNSYSLSKLPAPPHYRLSVGGEEIMADGWGVELGELWRAIQGQNVVKA